MEAEELVTNIVKELVDNSDSTSVKSIQSGSLTIFEINVVKDDVGKVIGKQGRIILAIRTLVNAIGSKNGKRFLLEVPNS